MKQLHIIFIIAIAVMLMAVPAMADCNGDGGPLKAADLNANTYGQIDTHAFHTVRGVTVVNMNQGNGNITLAGVSVNFGYNNGGPLGEVNRGREVSNTEVLCLNDEGERKFNRIAAHAFHDIKGVTMVQMNSGYENLVATGVNVNMSTSFMKNAGDLFYLPPHDH